MPGGRPRTPAPLRLLEGNRGHRPIPDEIQVDNSMPERPEYLDGLAAKCWDRLAPKLHPVGLLKFVDADALAAYCVAYADWREAARDVKKNGQTVDGVMGVQVVNPAFRNMQTSLDQMQKLMKQFGLSPAARAALMSGIDSKKPADPFTEAMGA